MSEHTGLGQEFGDRGVEWWLLVTTRRTRLRARSAWRDFVCADNTVLIDDDEIGKRTTGVYADIRETGG